jgi:hypothetical protein
MDINPLLPVQKITLKEESLRFIVPFSMSVSGPSQSGKTEFIVKLVQQRQNLFTSEFSRIIYCQPESLSHRQNDCFERIKKSFSRAELVNGLPSVSKLNLDLNNLPCLLIIDDQMMAVLDSAEMLDLLTVRVGLHEHMT